MTRDDSTGNVALYVDAKSDGSGVTSTGSLTRNANARVGYGYDGAALLQGLIDDVRIYDVVLTPAQLTNLTDGSSDPETPAKDPLAPTVTPADNATGVAADANMTLAFNRAPTGGTGNIEIHRADDDSTVATIAADDTGQVSISDSTVTVNPTAALETSTTYYMLIDADAFKDSDGDFYAGISDSTAWSFTTVNAPPIISGASPEQLNLNEDAGPVTVTLTATDDVDTATLAWSVKSQASAGTAMVVAPGAGGSASFSYTPDLHWYGTDSFVVEAADSAGAIDDFTVPVSVTSSNHAPAITQGNSVDLSVDENGRATLSLAATDADGDALSWSLAAPATSGVVVLTPATGSSTTVSYTPFAGFQGADQFVVRVVDNRGGSYSTTVNVSVRPDNDDDGVDSSVEAAAPNSGDANDDGVPDSAQPNVASFPNPQTHEYVSVAVDNSCTLSAVGMASDSDGVSDPGFGYPVGLVNFKATCAVGATTPATVYFSGTPDEELVVRKFNPTTNKYATIDTAAVTRLAIGGKTVFAAHYLVVDGGPLDTDGVANGIIVDPVGLALAAERSPRSTSPNTPDADNSPATPAPPNVSVKTLPFTGVPVALVTAMAVASVTIGMFLLRAGCRRRD